MRNAECGMPNAETRLTPHSSPLCTPHSARRTQRAFTLIELLIVIAVIALLAAMTFPAMRAARLSVMRGRAKAEMREIAAVIERYHDKLGYYPPDNPANFACNQLYYELEGTTLSNNIYFTLDGSAQFPNNPTSFQNAFGAATTVSGFMNCVRPDRHGDEARNAVSFLPDLKPSQFLVTDRGGVPVTILGSGLEGPLMYQNTAGTRINPWCYNSTSPRYNTKSFDLWMDVMAGSKTNRICNWSEKPLVVSTPYP
jgi:prepilin-type N-terminal cleavage/methylation domain-containing protein